VRYLSGQSQVLKARLSSERVSTQEAERRAGEIQELANQLQQQAEQCKTRLQDAEARAAKSEYEAAAMAAEALSVRKCLELVQAEEAALNNSAVVRYARLGQNLVPELQRSMARIVGRLRDIMR